MAAEVRLVCEARAFAAHLLRRHRRHTCTPELVDDVRIIVDELVANAVLHSGTGSVTLTVASQGPQVLIMVTDFGTWYTHPTDTTRAMAETGRGLDVVKALSTSSGIRKEPSGTCAWASLAGSQSEQRP
ncbi:ATP-binding protein [Streptomyces sp. CA-106131]|uniref:ATP-binding protein n=1 Tax=Streptomyces sp. CA-106131 TaxID=3240045 RepID=UPI003D931914